MNSAPFDPPRALPTDATVLFEVGPSDSTLAWLDRDHCILTFNARVLDWAGRAQVPLLERLRYLCIVASNLDEFFEVRMAAHLDKALVAQPPGCPSADFEALSAAVRELVQRQYVIYNEQLLPALAEQGIRIVTHGERNGRQRAWVRRYFQRQVRPLLLPVGLDPLHPFPQVPNKLLHFIVRLQGVDALGRANEVAIVKVPRVLPRLVELPRSLGGHGRHFVSLSSVIRSHLEHLFPGRKVTEFSQFRVTRHSELAIDEEDVRNLRTAVRQGLQQRHFGQAVRLEVSAGCSQFLADFLLHHFDLPPPALYRLAGPVNLMRLSELIDLAPEPTLQFAPWTPYWPRMLRPGLSILQQLRRGDLLVHQPFESFDAVLGLLREAVQDPQVLAIKQTIYRTGADSELMQLLCEAVRRGKEVTAVVELKARFDEEANINWAEALEAVGAQVVFGVMGLKTHAKMLLLTRREGRQLRRYGHLGTGNYNPRTARLYTDISHLTADLRLTSEMDSVFSHLASHSRLPPLQHLWLAPFHLQRRLLNKIEQLAAAARQGQPARLVAKMNALTDQTLIEALVRAGQAGVQIDLIVRGACMLPAQLPGCTQRIRVRSIVGRFLEHSRLFYFGVGEAQELYLSSADWMSRNMLRRVELAWPVYDPKLRQRLIDECLVAYLHDERDAWLMGTDGSYRRVEGTTHGQGAQDALMLRYGPKS